MCKDSFVFRKEWRDAVSGMSAEMRLEFYEAVIEYATTGNEPNLKPMARLAFNFAKATLDKDVERYKQVSNARKEAANKRWNKEESNAIACKPMQSDAKNAIAQYDNDNDCDNDLNKEELSIESKKKEIVVADDLSRDEGFLQRFMSNQGEIETMLMKFHIDRKTLKEMTDDILNDWKLSEQFHLSYNDFARHLMNTIRIKVREAGKGVNPKQEELKKAAEHREQESEHLMKKLEEMRRNAVSREEAMNSEEYKRAMAEA